MLSKLTTAISPPPVHQDVRILTVSSMTAIPAVQSGNVSQTEGSRPGRICLLAEGWQQMNRQQMLPAMAARLCHTPSAAIAQDTVQCFQRQLFTRCGSLLLSCTEMNRMSLEGRSANA